MYDPKEVFTEEGYAKHHADVCSLEHTLFNLMNNADDLHIGALDPEQLDTIYKMFNMVSGPNPLLLTGDGETEE